LTLNWTGGNATDVVEIIGFSGVPVGASTTVYDADVFLCLTTADKRTFTVPSSVLSQVMATPASGAGALMFLSSTRPTSGNGMFSAPLVPSGTTDLGVFLGTVGYISSASYK
jgi:hypothetical protein